MPENEMKLVVLYLQIETLAKDISRDEKYKKSDYPQLWDSLEKAHEALFKALENSAASHYLIKKPDYESPFAPKQ